MATPFPFTAGAVLTAGQLNSIGEYLSYTPTWTNLTIGNGTNSFTYGLVNKFVHVHGKMTFGSTTSISGAVSMSLPVNATGGSVEINGGATFQDTGTNTYWGLCRVATSTTVAFEVYNVSGTYATAAAMSATVPHTWTNLDIIYVSFVYEAA